jgi:crotonobetainyl-CoA:carnitine CoA-transferase CaiB-like acyl-CoA transferase
VGRAQPQRHVHDIYAGKLGLSLNLKNPRGRQILEDLIRGADIVVEGFSPGTMKRMGLGYDRLRELNPDIIYVQQSGFGEAGTYANGRAYGPTAQAITGISDMSGLPSPYPPAGIGYSYLDWFGAYNMALAMLAALYRRDVTGEGCHVDASQSEAGLYIAGNAILDYSVNGRSWARYGNRSPYVPAAPHGAFPTQGNDRWIAIAVFDDTHWTSLASVLGDPLLADDDRFATKAACVQNEDVLEALIGELTKDWDGFELMSELQALGVTAGVCQTAEDRCETDPQLRHLNWLVERDQTSIGGWPVRELPTKFSGTPADMGGILGRSGPDYGEDTDYVLRSILGLTADEVTELREQGAV